MSRLPPWPVVTKSSLVRLGPPTNLGFPKKLLKVLRYSLVPVQLNPPSLRWTPPRSLRTKLVPGVTLYAVRVTTAP